MLSLYIFRYICPADVLLLNMLLDEIYLQLCRNVQYKCYISEKSFCPLSIWPLNSMSNMQHECKILVALWLTKKANTFTDPKQDTTFLDNLKDI